MRKRRRYIGWRDGWRPDPPPELSNRDLQVGDMLLRDDGDVYVVKLTSTEHFSHHHGTSIIDALKLQALTSGNYISSYGARASELIDDAWLWHNRVGCLL